MNKLVLSMILCVMLGGYLAKIGILPQPVKYLPEFLSAVTALTVFILGAQQRFRDVRPAYWFAFAVMALVMICGALADGIESGPLVAGLRSYLRAVPFFFLPAVYAFSDRQIRSQLLLLLALGVLQLPIAINQRYFAMWMGDRSGDYVSGTLATSGLLSIFLICAACILTGAFLRKRIPFSLFFPLFLLLLAPTMINETKVTVIFLPLGLLTVFLAGSPRGVRLKNTVIAASLLAVFGAIFVPVYDYFVVQRQYGTPIAEFFTDKKKFDSYMGQNARVGTRNIEQIGRLDALMTPAREMAREATRFTFGMGIGNASESSLGAQFTGRHYQDFGLFAQTAVSVFILEIGFLGLAIVLAINYLIYRDSRAVADAGVGLWSALAVGWAGAVVVMVAADFYLNTLASEMTAYLFWYFSGLIAGERVRLARNTA